jgi:hypothetical protein
VNVKINWCGQLKENTLSPKIATGADEQSRQYFRCTICDDYDFQKNKQLI